MKKRANFFYIWLMVVVSLMFSGGCDKSTQQKQFDWSKNYRESGTQPYDLAVMYQLLKNRNQGFEVITNNLNEKLSEDRKSNFLYIGYEDGLDSTGVQWLLEYVKKGNNAYLATEITPEEILYQIYNYYYSVYFYPLEQNGINVQFTTDERATSFDYEYDHQKLSNDWDYIDIDTLNIFSDTKAPTVLSSFNDTLANYIRIDYGEGHLYLHSIPLLFTNFHMVKEEGFQHAEKVFSTLLDGPVMWDRSRYYIQEEISSKNSSPLKILFSHRSLKWAWYSLLLGVLLYILFRSKRMQRIIPVLAQNRNDSVEFVRNLGILFFRKGTHDLMAAEMYSLFLSDVRGRYKIDTNLEQKDLELQIAKRSGLNEKTIDELMVLFELRYHELAKAPELIKLHKALNNYYKTRK